MFDKTLLISFHTLLAQLSLAFSYYLGPTKCVWKKRLKREQTSLSFSIVCSNTFQSFFFQMKRDYESWLNDLLSNILFSNVCAPEEHLIAHIKREKKWKEIRHDSRFHTFIISFFEREDWPSRALRPVRRTMASENLLFLLKKEK